MNAIDYHLAVARSAAHEAAARFAYKYPPTEEQAAIQELARAVDELATALAFSERRYLANEEERNTSR